MKKNKKKMRVLQSQKGITLIALVVTIIIMMILVAISMSLLGENGVIDRSREAKFKANISSVEESVVMYVNDKQLETYYSGTEYTEVQKVPVKGDKITSTTGFRETLIEEIKEKTGKENIAESNIYYIDKDKAKLKLNHNYILDIDSYQVYDVEGEKFGGKYHHTLNSFEVGKVPETNDDLETPDPIIAVKDAIQFDFIPIYDIEDYKKIGTEIQNYEIYDLKDTSVGVYNMNKDAKYQLMEDIDFKDAGDIDTIKGFRGIFDGNGHTISNITITETDPEPDKDYITYPPTGMFDRIIGGKVTGLIVENANILGKTNVGIIAGQIEATEIENCIIRNSTATSDGASQNGSIGAVTGWVYQNNSTNSSISNIKVSDTNVSGKSVTSGILGTNQGNVTISNCYVVDSNIYTETTASEGQGGIIGWNASGATVSECKVVGTNFSNNCTGSQYVYANCGGIIGSNSYDGTYVTNVNSCKVKDVQLAYAQNCGGIYGTIHSSSQQLNINDCDVENVNLKGKVKAGILANLLFSKVKIDGCNVTNLTNEKSMELSSSSSSPYMVGGMVGSVYYSKGIEITDCNLNESELIYDNSSDKACLIAGIMASHVGRDSDCTTKIDNCKVNNSTLQINMTGNENSSSDNTIKVAGISVTGGAPIANCEVNDSYLKIIATTTSYGDNYCVSVSGVNVTNYADSYVEMAVDSTNINNTEIYTNYGTASGITKCGTNYNIQNCNIKNSKIYAKHQAAGVACEMMNGTIIKNVNVENTEIVSEVYHAGGILNFMSSSDATVEMCKVTNSTIKCLGEVNNVAYSPINAVAGIVSVNVRGQIKTCTKDSKTSLINNTSNGIIGEITAFNLGTIVN